MKLCLIPEKKDNMFLLSTPPVALAKVENKWCAKFLNIGFRNNKQYKMFIASYKLRGIWSFSFFNTRLQRAETDFLIIWP